MKVVVLNSVDFHSIEFPWTPNHALTKALTFGKPCTVNEKTHSRILLGHSTFTIQGWTKMPLSL